MTSNPYRVVLLPGRHHAFTRAQAAWLAAARAGQLRDRAGDPIVLAPDAILAIAVTSANHAATRRNPVSAAHRVAQAELFLHIERIPGLVVAIPDLPATDQFASRVIADVVASPGLTIPIDPSTTLVAVSTPVGDMYADLGYRIGGIELDMPGAPYAWDLVEAAAGGDTGRFHQHAHPATVDVWARYGLLAAVADLFDDDVVSGTDGGLTDTRDYRPYAAAFQATAARKWAEIRDWVVAGPLLDVGCATGAMLVEAGRDPRLAGHPVHGLEADRWLHAEALHALEQGGFPNPLTFLRRGNILTPGLYSAGTIATTITAALTHEIYSYGDGDRDLAALTARIAEHTAPGGVWINSDLAAPADADRIVRMTLATGNGDAPVVRDSDALSAPQLAGELEGQSTATRFAQYARDRRRPFDYTEVAPGVIDLRLGDAMEFLLHKDYTDSWHSELAETYTFRSWAGWRDELAASGWTFHPESAAYTNAWIVENRLDPVASLSDPQTGAPVAWPDTHVRFAAYPPPR